MLFFGKPLKAIDRADLQRLIDNAQPEDKSLEYKETAYTKEKRDDFLADASAFANTTDGLLLLGVKSDKGLPIALSGIPNATIDDTCLRIQCWMRDCLDPRLDGVERTDVDLGNGHRVLIFGIPKSWSRPHMVKTTGRFYVRTNSGNEPCDCGQVRSLVLQADEISKRIRAWRAERIAVLLANEGPERLVTSQNFSPQEPAQEPPLVAIHVVPLGGFGSGRQIDLAACSSMRIEPMAWSGGNCNRYCLDGMVWDSLGTNKQREQVCMGYNLLFRDGCVESVSAAVIQPTESSSSGYCPLYGRGLETKILRVLTQIMQFYQCRGVEAPLIVMLSLLRVKEYFVIEDTYNIPGNLRPLARDVLMLPEVIVPDLADSPDKFMKPIFDTFWNASGWPGSPSYDEAGNRIERQ